MRNNMYKQLERIRERYYRRLHNDGEDWVTINGTHVMIDDQGQVSKGPTALKEYYSKKNSRSGNSNSTQNVSGTKQESSKSSAGNNTNSNAVTPKLVTNWHKDTIWKHGAGFNDTMNIHPRKQQLDFCGDGFEVVGCDGNHYWKMEGKWVDEYAKKANISNLMDAKFAGDFFDVNLGINGLPSEECDKLREKWNSIDLNAKERCERLFRESSFRPFNGKRSHYDPETNSILVGIEFDLYQLRNA